MAKTECKNAATHSATGTSQSGQKTRKTMKKLILSIAVLLAASQGFAHGWTVSRRTCLGGDRYQAWASLSEAKAIPTSDGGFMVWMIVGYSGTQPVYGWVYHSGPVTDRVEIAKTRNVGCSRPKSTWCNHPKGISYGFQRQP